MTAAHLLVVEDEPLIQEILLDNLNDAGYQTTAASNGEEAWRLIESQPNAFDVIILDRLMPDMDGIEVLRRIKQNPALTHVPVIMQTSLTSDQDIADGLQAGAYYYLTKPFAAEPMLAIVGHAVADRQSYLALQEEVKKTSNTLRLLDHAEFHFRTREDARALAAVAAQATHDPQRVVLGLSELLLNAVEHGNLQISYEEKSEFLNLGSFEQEVTKRLASPVLGNRIAVLRLEREGDQIRFIIADEGNGFDWTNYLEISPDRAFDAHGRGIAMARMLSFDSLTYQGNGNTVVAAIRTPASH